MPMYTQCPECLAIYKITAANVVAARGRVRCASCAAEFDALATLADELPPEPVHDLPRHDPEHEPPLLAVPSLRPQSSQPDMFNAGEGSAPAPRGRSNDPNAFAEAIGNRARAGATAGPSRDQTLRAHRERPAASAKGAAPPSFARAHAHRSATAGSLGWGIGAAVLALALGTQFAWAYRAELLAEPKVHRALEDACARLRCSIPAVADTNRITVLARDVSPHPSVAGALLVSATIQNQAPYAQPFPTVQITLADPDDQRIAMRRFQPSEYVTDATALARGLAADATASLSIEIEDPGKNAVAFEFKFL